MANARKVLFIDDSEVALAMVQEALTREGYDVLTRQTPFGSMAAIRRTRPALVILDVCMPALGGEDLLTLLRRNHELSRTLVLLYSTQGPEVLAPLAARYGAAGHVTKSATTDELVAAVNRLIGPDADVDATQSPQGTGHIDGSSLQRETSIEATDDAPPSADSPTMTSGTRVPEESTLPSLAFPRPDKTSISLLFVAEDQQTLRLFRRAFSDFSYTAFLRSGEDALNLLQSDLPPSVIVVHLSLPDMSPVEFHKRALEANPALQNRFVFVSRLNADEEAAAYIQEVGAILLHEPVDMEALRAAIVAS